MSFKYHAFVCVQSRPQGHPRGCCTSKGGGNVLFERLMQNMQQKMLWQNGVSVAQASCLGFCDAGPLMVVYPENTWYRPETPADIDEIVQSHFVEGNPVERLVVKTAK